MYRLRVLKDSYPARAHDDGRLNALGNVCGNERGSVLPSSIQKAGRDSDSLTMTPNSYGSTRAAMVPSDTKPVETLQAGGQGRVLMAHGGPSKIEDWDVAIVNINILKTFFTISPAA